MNAQRSDLRGTVFWIAALTLVWGLFWPISKVALSAIPILSFRAFCALSGAAGLFALSIFRRQRLRIAPGEFGQVVLASLFNVTGWFWFSAIGLTLLPSGRAALLAYTAPLWAFLIAIPVLGEPISGRRLLGLGFGLGGIALLGSGSIPESQNAMGGILAMLGGALCLATGTVWQKRILWRTPLLTLTAWQLLIGGLPLTVAALCTDIYRVHMVSSLVLLATAYTVVFGVVFGYYAWFRIIAAVSVEVATLSTLVIPVIGVGSGALLLGEVLGLREIAAAVLIVSALATIRRVEPVTAGREQTPAD